MGGHSTHPSPFTATLYFFLLLVSYLIEYFHQAIKFSVHYFREPCHFLLYLFLEIAINHSFHLLSLVILFVSSVRFISSEKLLSPEMIKNVFKYFKSQKKEALSNKNYFSADVWTFHHSPDMFTINVTLQGCYSLSLLQCWRYWRFYFKP